MGEIGHNGCFLCINFELKLTRKGYHKSRKKPLKLRIQYSKMNQSQKKKEGKKETDRKKKK